MSTTETRILVDVPGLARLGRRTVAASNIYTCPAEVPAGETNVAIDAFPPNGADGPIRVRVGSVRPKLARSHPNPAPGERVLLCLMNYDLLSLWVATVAEPAPVPRAEGEVGPGESS
jgi:hypothetical protein